MSAAEQAILHLLDERGADKTICPSEAARKLARSGGSWREYMDDIHHATDRLLDADIVRLSWKGEQKEKRRGPYRIARRP